MAMVAPGAPGGSGPPGGKPPWRIDDGLEPIFIDEDDLEEEESSEEEEWADYQHTHKGAPGLRQCKYCHYLTYLRKGACANPGCEVILACIEHSLELDAFLNLQSHGEQSLH